MAGINRRRSSRPVTAVRSLLLLSAMATLAYGAQLNAERRDTSARHPIQEKEIRYRLTILPAFAGKMGVANAINDAGTVVGHASFSNTLVHGYVYARGHMTDVGTLGGNVSDALAINAQGEVVGTTKYDANLRDSYGYIYKNGKAQALIVFGGAACGPAGINKQGHIVGFYRRNDFNRAFVTEPIPRDVGTLGGRSCEALGINDSDEIVGDSENASGHIEAFLLSSGRFTDLGTLGGDASFANAINNHEEIVGSAFLPKHDPVVLGPMHAFRWFHGRMTDLGTLPGAQWSYAAAINAQGDIVGRSGDVKRGDAAILYHHGHMYDLNLLTVLPAGVRLENATGINSHGLICGTAKVPGGKLGFVLTPVNGQ